MDDEIWKPVVGFEGWYEISSHGRVKRIMRGKGFKRSMLSPTLMKIGYYSLILSKGSIPTRVRKYVHKLVAEAFIGECPIGMVTNHKDADKLHNHPSNLEYVPQTENIKHAQKLGLFPSGERCYGAKLTDNDVREIRDLQGYYTVRKLQELYGVNCGVISEIQNRKRWKHVA